jgi:hypothetical protein
VNEEVVQQGGRGDSSNEEEDTCMAYEEEDTCMSYEEERGREKFIDINR